MANVLEIDLIPRLAREVGDTDSSNLYYTPDQLFSALNDGLEDMNEEMYQQYSVTGSGNTAYYVPTPSDIDKRLLVLYSARVLARGEMALSSRTGIVHTNPAGRTDLSQRPAFFEAQIKHYDKMIARLRHQRGQRGVDDKLDEEGSQEIRNKATGTTTYVEGLPITTITTTT